MIWLLFISGVLLIIFTLFSFYVGYCSSCWPIVLGKVQRSCVVVKTNKASSSNNKYYHPFIIYEYILNNKRHVNNKIGNYLVFGDHEEYAKELVKDYPENGEAIVYYCPFYHGLSVLIPGMKQILVHSILLFTGIVIVIGFSPALFTENPTWFIDKIFSVINYVT